MDDASRIGIILEGRAQAQKSFPNGSQVNVSVRTPGELIGAAAVFSSNHQYPCDVVALEPVTIMMFRREDILSLMQRDIRVLENFMTEIASATYMLQQRLELFSYNGIAQKAAFWLLLRVRQSGKDTVKIPDSISKWAMLMNVSRPSLHRELKRLENAEIIEVIRGTELVIRVTYPQAGKLQYVFARENLPACEIEYGQDVIMHQFVPRQDVTRIRKLVIENTDGKAEFIEENDKEYTLESRS